MAQKTKIKKDSLGLYVVAGGWICRPFFGTMFNEGDKVKSHHFGGSTNAGVTLDEKELKFTKIENYETWSTTGTGAYEYSKMPLQKLKESYDWYKNHSKSLVVVYEKYNKEFSNKYKNKLTE